MQVSNPAQQQVIEGSIKPSLGEKYSAQDVQVSKVLQAAATSYAIEYQGTFPFMCEMYRTAHRYGLSPRQAAGVLNCLLAEARREASVKVAEPTVLTAESVKPVAQPAEQPVQTSPVLPDGTYTVGTDSEDYVTIEVTTPGEGSKFYGKRIASYLDGPDNGSDYRGFAFIETNGGTHEPQARIWRRFDTVGKQARALRALLTMTTDGLAEAGYTYALKSGKCCKCGRKLTVPASLHRGMGPVCASK